MNVCVNVNIIRFLVFSVQTLLYFEYSQSFPSLHLQLHLIVDVHDKMVTTLYLSFTIAALLFRAKMFAGAITKTTLKRLTYLRYFLLRSVILIYPILKKLFKDNCY